MLRHACSVAHDGLLADVHVALQFLDAHPAGTETRGLASQDGLAARFSVDEHLPGDLAAARVLVDCHGQVMPLAVDERGFGSSRFVFARPDKPEQGLA